MITSRSNPLVTETAKLKEKKHREFRKAFLFEGIKLTREAIHSNVDILNVFLTQKCAIKYPELANRKDAVLISDSVCEKLSENSAPEGIICTAKYIDRLHKNLEDVNARELQSACLLISSLQDPGNLGTIARTSAAFGKNTLILSEDCADIYNQKTIRASMGAIFRMTIYKTDELCKVIKALRAKKISVYATALTKNAMPVQKVSDIKNSCFVLGNEGHGLDGDIIKNCTGTVIIPMEKDAESLNVSSAASVILWETYR